MGETLTVRDGKFLRPRTRRQEKGGEQFQGIVKKAIRVAFQLLLLSFFLFIGHWVYVHLLSDSYFRLREVEVEGGRKIPKETLLSLAAMEGMPNLFSVKLKEVVKRLESHPWIEQVRVRKVFPHKIVIQVEERKPMAIIQLEELYYIDTRGEIFTPVGDRDEYNYPYVTGLTRRVFEKDPVEAKRLINKALELLRIVSQGKVPPLGEISEIHMEKAFGIYCFTKAEGVEVKMGWEDFEEKLKRLPLIWSDLRKRGFSAVSIDCSDVTRMVVKIAP
ncbi:MAG: FtsQ-type POTRA domain-containing protein [Desulfobacterales bacterium]|jgi:cell division septal protein FtsQ|nr:FtsQ-type POTRA domain-containing protein [Desulfobacterales bacterium]